MVVFRLADSFVRPLHTTCKTLSNRDIVKVALKSLDSGLIVRRCVGANPNPSLSLNGIVYTWKRFVNVLETVKAEQDLEKKIGYKRSEFLPKALEIYQTVNKAFAKDDKKTLQQNTTQTLYSLLAPEIRLRQSSEKNVYELQKVNEFNLVSLKIFHAKDKMVVKEHPGTTEFVQATVYFDTLQKVTHWNRGRVSSKIDENQHIGEWVVFERKLSMDNGPTATWKMCGRL
eukprot:TRINITY_DN2654_c0_g2_i6.p1 TRINITY_DN2654_c0_g2~~TRINITY_DN2654_c0_g2_i6.p1  ORF type:complete len:229 (-),score=46.60 TRINITY_DN2654_c0_g2_i6:259-945(-)